MKTKLHFGILAVFLAFLVTFVEQTTVPNQQIVIQFSDEANTEQDTENAIEAIQKKLQSIGVTQIQIGQQEDGQLKIIYYSDSDVKRIKSILSKEEGFKLTYDSSQKNSHDFPENEPLKDYELNISEIHNSSDTNWDFEGVEIVEWNQKSDRFDNPKDTTSGEQLSTQQSNNVFKVAIKVNNTTALTIDHISYKIPEVRAGPSA